MISDGYVGADGRHGFRNTSRHLSELFSVLCFWLNGSFPEVALESGSAGGLTGTDDAPEEVLDAACRRAQDAPERGEVEREILDVGGTQITNRRTRRCSRRVRVA